MPAPGRKFCRALKFDARHCIINVESGQAYGGKRVYRLLIVTTNQATKDMLASMEGWEAVSYTHLTLPTT